MMSPQEIRRGRTTRPSEGPRFTEEQNNYNNQIQPIRIESMFGIHMCSCQYR